MADLPYAYLNLNHPFWLFDSDCCIDRLSTNGWEGQSLVVTLARTSAPTKPVAGPTRSPLAMMQGYMSGYSTPPQSQGNMTMPPSPVSPE